MTRCSTLDISQPKKVASLEVSTTMLELPKRRVWGAVMEDITDYRISQQLMMPQ